MHLPERRDAGRRARRRPRVQRRPAVDGILVQHPTPPQIDFDAALLAMDPDKDVDGMHPVNMGRLALMMPGPVPCTPAGIEALLAYYEIPVAGHEVVHPRPRHHARPPARAAALAEAPDRQRRGHRGAHRRARLARVHPAGRHRRRRRRRARHPPARAHLARARWSSAAACATRAASCCPTSTSACEEVAGCDHPAGRRRRARPPSPCCSATPSRRPSDGRREPGKAQCQSGR